MSRRELGERLFVHCAVHFIFSKESGISNPRYGTCVYVSVDITWRRLNDGNNISSVWSICSIRDFVQDEFSSWTHNNLLVRFGSRLVR